VADKRVASKRVVYRLTRGPGGAVNYDYLVASDNIGELAHVDVLTVRGDVRRAKEKLKKAKPGTGLEILVAPARKADPAAAGRWFSDVRELYGLCQSLRCQFVLSSGAGSPSGMVSGQSFDAILRTCGIDPQRHWRDMGAWLDSRLQRRVKIR
jgi:hypothetical protein